MTLFLYSLVTTSLSFITYWKNAGSSYLYLAGNILYTFVESYNHHYLNLFRFSSPVLDFFFPSFSHCCILLLNHSFFFIYFYKILSSFISSFYSSFTFFFYTRYTFFASFFTDFVYILLFFSKLLFLLTHFRNCNVRQKTIIIR